MKDKDLVGIITLVAMILYFYPFYLLKFVSLGVLLFFSPGFFLLKILYRDMDWEELVLLSVGISVSLSGSIALILAIFSLLQPLSMLLSLTTIIIVGYFLSSSIDIKLKKFGMMDKFAALMIVLMVIVAGVWLYMEFHTERYREIDMGIVSWPENSTVNSTLSFDIYLKNWNYGDARCTVEFYLNEKFVEKKDVFLKNGDKVYLYFTTHSNHTGKNIAKFNLYVNGKYFTEVHVYFYLKS